MAHLRKKSPWFGRSNHVFLYLLRCQKYRMELKEVKYKHIEKLVNQQIITHRECSTCQLLHQKNSRRSKQ